MMLNLQRQLRNGNFLEIINKLLSIILKQKQFLFMNIDAIIIINTLSIYIYFTTYIFYISLIFSVEIEGTVN